MPSVRGYRTGAIDVRALVAEIRGRGVMLVRADRMYGREHLEHAARLAQRAIRDGRARSLDAPTETLLYAAGDRQIQKALALLGLTDATRAIAVVAWDAPFADALAARHGWTRDDHVLAGDEATLDALGITADERAMLPREQWGDLVLEKVALVDVLKA